MLNYPSLQEKGEIPLIDMQELVGWLKALSEPKRLLLLDLIVRGAHCNCDLSEESGMAPNLISHHLGVLREACLVNTERDPLDARWVYYTVNRKTLSRLNEVFVGFFDPDRIQPRRLTCGPEVIYIPDNTQE